MKISNHAQKRSQQRGFNKFLIQLIYQHGHTTRRPGNAQEIYITKKIKADIISELRKSIQALDKISSKSLISSNDGTIITMYNKNS